MMKERKLSAKEHALIFRETFYDQYDDEPKFTRGNIKNWTEGEAKTFVKNHIETMLVINRESELWECERKAARDLKIKIGE
jgi:hypothetical protein